LDACPFCWPMKNQAIIESTHCAYIENPDKVLVGSGMIVPKAHRETVFDLTLEEVNDTFILLQKVKMQLDQELSPDGYNVGWNCYPVGGQTVPHAHLHIIPRFNDEPMAGKGIRHHLKQKENRRTRIE
jgi:diadenosine tetraphosphate (Ap4A) HIT family hydrolase